MRFSSHHAHSCRSPRILISPQKRHPSKFAIELLDMNEEISGSYSLTLIAVGGNFEMGTVNGGIVSSPAHSSSFFQIEGNIDELNHLLRKTTFSPQDHNIKSSWLTVHIEKVGASSPIVDCNWREISSLENTLSQSIDQSATTLPLEPLPEKSLASSR